MRKVFVFLLVLHVICANVNAADELTAEQKEMIKNLHDTCVAETGVKESDLEDASKGKFSNDRSLKCYLKCWLTSVGVMEDDGTVDFNVLLDLTPESHKGWVKVTAAKCSNIKPEGDACETAYKINVCSYNANPAMYIVL